MASAFIIPGRRAGNIKQLINRTCNEPYASCSQPINTKIVRNSNPDVIPNSSRVSRIVTQVSYPKSGITIFGNTYQPKPLPQSTIINYLDSIEISPNTFIEQNQLSQLNQQNQQNQLIQQTNYLAQFFNCNTNKVTFLGGTEGQPGGIARQPKNKF
jgi:hypothetical protein